MFGRKDNNDELRREIAGLKVIIQSHDNAIKSLYDFHNQHEYFIGNNTNEVQALRLELDYLKDNIFTKKEIIELLESAVFEVCKRNQRAEKKIVKLRRKLKVLQKYSPN